jgi:hypothetical protein
VLGDNEELKKLAAFDYFLKQHPNIHVVDPLPAVKVSDRTPIARRRHLFLGIFIHPLWSN